VGHASSERAQSPPAQTPPQQEQRPIFRADAHFVRVDAYPVRDGKIIEGLTPADFEVFEDSQPQAIESLEFVTFDRWTPHAGRRDPQSQQEAFQLAADPRYRVFVIYLDVFSTTWANSAYVRQPLLDMLNRMLGPNDLFGLLTPSQDARDLVLGQRMEAVEEQLTRFGPWGRADRRDLDPEEERLAACGMAHQIGERRASKVFSDLHELVLLLGALREERKNIILFSDGFAQVPWQSRGARRGGPMRPPSGGGVQPPRIPGLGLPKPPIGGGRIEPDHRRRCEPERSSVVDPWDRTLLEAARQNNVAIYTVSTAGLMAPVMPSVGTPRSAVAHVNRELDAINRRVDSLLTIAHQTDGIAVVNTNDLRDGLQRVADDLESYYVLGYYTSNRRWDGLPRRISVRLKKTGERVRARREYRAPTDEEMTALRRGVAAANSPPAPPSPAETARAALARLRPSAALHLHGRVHAHEMTLAVEIPSAPIEVGRWSQGADVQVTVSGEGNATGAARARIEPGARGALARLPVEGAGPWPVVIRVSGRGEEMLEDQITIQAATGALVGDPLVFRAMPAAASPFTPAAGFEFRRTERVRIEWPVAVAIDRYEARLLNAHGDPLPLAVTLAEEHSADGRVLAAGLSLSALAVGDYVVEVLARAGEVEDRKFVAIRVR
jgi:VWFA-related protein